MDYTTYNQIIALGIPASKTDPESINGPLAGSFAESSRLGFLDLNLDAIIEKKVKEEIASVLNSQNIVEFRKIPLKNAKAEIHEFLESWLSAGKETINTFDISLGLRLPGDQVEKVMSLLSKKGHIKEI